MTDLTLFVGLDVHKKTISVAMVEGSAGTAARFCGTIANYRMPCADYARSYQRTGRYCTSATKLVLAGMVCSVS